MKPLTDNEVLFIQQTGWTMTALQCNEWDETIFSSICPKGTELSDFISDYAEKCYDVNYSDLIKKCSGVEDCISLENMAIYLLYKFFTADELEIMRNEQTIEWLKNFKYYVGFRKCEDATPYIQQAYNAANGVGDFYTDKEGDVWYFEKEPVCKGIFTKIKRSKRQS